MATECIVTPVLFIVFNRPDSTGLVFDMIRRVRPSRLYIAADGPRSRVDSDVELCKRVRSVKDSVDWNCKVSTLYRDENMGSDRAVFYAINWFFENENEGIILEDDCLPDEKFFRFSQELLDRYRDDQRVMQICGSNPLGEWTREGYSYYFSRHGPVRGWASWRRAWKLNRFEKSRYEAIRKHGYFDEYFPSRMERQLWFRRFDSVASNTDQEKSWRYRWDFSRFIQTGLSIIPHVNLVSSLDLDGELDVRSYQPGSKDALIHPPVVMRNMEADKKYFSAVLSRDEQI